MISRTDFHLLVQQAQNSLTSRTSPVRTYLPLFADLFRMTKGATQSTYTVPFLITTATAGTDSINKNTISQWRNNAAQAGANITGFEYQLAGYMIDKNIEGFVSLSTERRVVQDKQLGLVTVVVNNDTNPALALYN